MGQTLISKVITIKKGTIMCNLNTRHWGVLKNHTVFIDGRDGSGWKTDTNRVVLIDDHNFLYGSDALFDINAEYNLYSTTSILGTVYSSNSSNMHITLSCKGIFCP